VSNFYGNIINKKTFLTEIYKIKLLNDKLYVIFWNDTTAICSDEYNMNRLGNVYKNTIDICLFNNEPYALKVGKNTVNIYGYREGSIYKLLKKKYLRYNAIRIINKSENEFYILCKRHITQIHRIIVCKISLKYYSQRKNIKKSNITQIMPI
jgi:hypothetical protein